MPESTATPLTMMLRKVQVRDSESCPADDSECKSEPNLNRSDWDSKPLRIDSD